MGRKPKIEVVNTEAPKNSIEHMIPSDLAPELPEVAYGIARKDNKAFLVEIRYDATTKESEVKEVKEMDDYAIAMEQLRINVALNIFKFGE